MNGLDHEGKWHGEHVTVRAGKRRTIWFEHGVMHRDDKPAFTQWFEHVDLPSVEIYVQNGVAYRPVPAGANSEEYPSMISHLHKVYFWHSPEGVLIRARKCTTTGVVRAGTKREREWIDAVVDNVQNTATIGGCIFHLDARGFIEKIVKQPIQPVDTPASTPEEACAICLVNKKVIAFVSCGHATWCDSCASKVDSCPSCRAKIDSRLRFYYN